MSPQQTAAARRSFLAAGHREAGARFQELRGAEVVRHFGDPAAEYEAAREGVAVVDRSHRAGLRIAGRSPRRMLDGLLTCTIPEAGEALSDEAVGGSGAYGAVLTPKGKMVTDLRVFPSAASEGEAFLLDVPAVSIEPLGAHLDKYLPPRFASREDVSDALGMLSVLGPGGAGLLARDAAGFRVGEEELDALGENGFVRIEAGDPDGGVRIWRCGDVDTPCFDVVADAPTIRALWTRLTDGAARAAGYATWEALRVEKGRPAYGTDMDDGTIPVEAGVHRRAIDYEKGCYTGQEVIVRIRDRGRVNWHLRGLLFGDTTPPRAGTELFEEGADRAVGRVTSALESPSFGEVAGLGYARREVEPPAELRVGAPDGEPVRVRTVGDRGWESGPAAGGDGGA